MKINSNVRRLRTTVGDLIVAITDVALQRCKNERTAYRITGIVFNRMLQPAPVVVTCARLKQRRSRQIQ
jgi:hypothetical protein